MIETHFKNLDLDVRKTRDARFMDQKVTPDVLCVVADCVINRIFGNRDAEFTSTDIISSEYFNSFVKSIFNKPGVENLNTSNEYDKFVSQPLKTLSYAGILTVKKVGRQNVYQINNLELLEYISHKEKFAYNFLYTYLLKVLTDSNEIKHFERFKELDLEGKLTKEDFQDLKERFTRFMIGNTSIGSRGSKDPSVEVSRIFTKVINVYSSYNQIQGTIKGFLSKRPIYFRDLMYNRENWRDLNKAKNITRAESINAELDILDVNPAYSEYLVQKAMSLIKKIYINSEVNDGYAQGIATQVHHIFSKSEFPQLAAYLENLIKLTPTQHFTYAHPKNNTQIVNKDYQLTCLLAKADSISKSINKGEYYYSKESFVHVINSGLNAGFDYSLTFMEIKMKLSMLYNVS